MPRVPTIEGQTQQTRALPGVQQHSVATPGMLASAFDDEQRAAGALMQTGGAIGNEALRMQDEANQLRVDDALTRLKEQRLTLTLDPQAGFANLKGLSALERPDGKALSDEYAERLDESAKAIGASLGNERQRAVFQQRAAMLAEQFRGDLLKHQSTQYQEYTLSVDQGRTKNALNEIGLHYNDPARIDENIATIRASAARAGRLAGQSAEEIEANTRDLTSRAHMTALAAALEKNDVGFADRYRKHYGDQMTASDALRIDGLITKEMDAQLATQAASAAMREVAPALDPTPADRLASVAGPVSASRLADAVMHQESRGKRYGKDGMLLTSAKGAKGEMQVLDGTNRDPGYGVRPAANDSPEERARVGRDYLDAMMRHYKGDVAKALAAYNAGPGAVDAAIRKAQGALAVAKDATRGELGVLPNTGKQAVSTEISVTVSDERLNGGKPTNIPLLVKGQKNVEALLKGEEPTEEQEDLAIQRAAQRVKEGASLPGYGTIEQAVKAAQSRSDKKGKDKSYFDATTPGDKGGDWMAYLPAETRAYVPSVLARYEKGEGAPKAPTLEDVHARVRASIGEGNPNRLKLALDDATRQFTAHQQARRQRDEEGEANAMRALLGNGGNFAALPASVKAAIPGKSLDNVMNFADKLSKQEEVQTDWSRYYELRRAAIDNPQEFARMDLARHFGQLGKGERESLIDLQARTKDPKEIADVATLEQQLSTAHNLMKWSPSDREKKGAFNAAVQTAVDTEQRRAGKKLTFEERQRIIDRMAVQGEVVSGKWYQIDPDKRFYEVANTVERDKFVPNVPKEDEAKIKDALTRAGMPVTADAVLNLYRQKRGL